MKIIAESQKKYCFISVVIGCLLYQLIQIDFCFQLFLVWKEKGLVISPTLVSLITFIHLPELWFPSFSPRWHTDFGCMVCWRHGSGMTTAIGLPFWVLSSLDFFFFSLSLSLSLSLYTQLFLMPWKSKRMIHVKDSLLPMGLPGYCTKSLVCRWGCRPANLWMKDLWFPLIMVLMQMLWFGISASRWRWGNRQLPVLTVFVHC